jgi:hypothetical protein
MKLYNLMTTAIALVLSVGVNAALVDNGAYTTDTESGLDWLDLSATDGLSYDSALANNPGYRHAMNAEVENLFGILFDGYFNNTPFLTSLNAANVGGEEFVAYSDQLEDIQSFQSLFGHTETKDFGTGSTLAIGSWGLYYDENLIVRLMGAYNRFTGNPLTEVNGLDYIENFDFFRNDGSDRYAWFMVSTVPVPAAFWLFGSGLFGLIGIARRKKPT